MCFRVNAYFKKSPVPISCTSSSNINTGDMLFLLIFSACRTSSGAIRSAAGSSAGNRRSPMFCAPKPVSLPPFQGPSLLSAGLTHHARTTEQLDNCSADKTLAFQSASWYSAASSEHFKCFFSWAALMPSSQGMVSSMMMTLFSTADHMTMSGRRVVVVISLGKTSCFLRSANIHPCESVL